MSITKKEIYEAKTFEALIALGKKHGRKSPQVDAWAKKIMEHRNRKQGV